MRSIFRRLLALVLPVVAASAVAAQPRYVPGRGSDWQHRTPEQVGFTKRAVDSAVAIAIANESTSPRDLMEAHKLTFGREPFGEAVGPFRARGGAAGLIVRHGYIVAEWGDPDRVDMTFSVTKSFVTTTIGLAYDRKLIAAITDPVRGYWTPTVALRGAPSGVAPVAAVPGLNTPGSGRDAKAFTAFDAFEMIEPFESEHNRQITWEHLLRQTSDWQGTLWGKPDIRYVSASDEHGKLEVGSETEMPKIGEKLRLVPGHCDPTVDKYDWYVGVRNGRVECLWPVAARGRNK